MGQGKRFSQAHYITALNNDITGPADRVLEDPPRLFTQPTAPEMSRLTYGLRDLRLGVQEEAGNDFAHLLNRGSSLE
jgi:hypothetical protein